MRNAALLSLLAFILILSSSWNDPPCFDEPEHINDGFCAVARGELWLNVFHPPLVKDLSGLAVALGGFQQPTYWDKYKKGRSLIELFEINDPQRLVRYARLPLVLLSSAFVGFLCLALTRSLGAGPALLAALLLTFSPSFLGHACFVHTDVPAAAFIFGSLWLFNRYLEKPDQKNLLILSFFVGVAQLVKYSLLVVYPFFVLVLILRKDRWERLRQVPVILLIGLVVVWAGYAVHHIPPQKQAQYNERLEPGPIKDGFQAMEGTPVLRELAWFGVGLFKQGRRLEKGPSHPTYLKGEYYQGGDWKFFPTTILTKVPPGGLFLLILGLGCLRLARPIPREVKLYLGFSALYLVVAMSSSVNLGVRHILPLFPCLFAFVGWSLWTTARLLEGNLQRVLQITVACALISMVFSCALAWPGYLSYFNGFAGKEPVLLDSNRDWGTDLFRLKLVAEEEGWDQLYTLYFGGLPDRVYLGDMSERFPFDHLPAKGRLAISLNYYVPLRAALTRELSTSAPPELVELRERLNGMEKVGLVGTSIVLLNLPEGTRRDYDRELLWELMTPSEQRSFELLRIHDGK